MGQLSASMQLVAAILLLLAFVFSHFGVTSAQYGNSGAVGTGPADAAGYLLGAWASPPAYSPLQRLFGPKIDD